MNVLHYSRQTIKALHEPEFVLLRMILSGSDIGDKMPFFVLESHDGASRCLVPSAIEDDLDLRALTAPPQVLRIARACRELNESVGAGPKPVYVSWLTIKRDNHDDHYICSRPEGPIALQSVTFNLELLQAGIQDLGLLDLRPS